MSEVAKEVDLALDRALGAFRKNVGETAEAAARKLRESVKFALEGNPEEEKRRIVDCTRAPAAPGKLAVVKHEPGGMFHWGKDAIAPLLTEGQERGVTVTGREVFAELRTHVLLNANVLDFLLGNQRFIPESLKAGPRGAMLGLCFWGTLYKTASNRIVVRYLFWSGNRWDSFYRCIDEVWMSEFYAAIRIMSIDK